MLVRHALAAGLFLALVLVVPAAFARGQLQAGPTQLEIGSETSSTRLTLRNTGDTPVAAQVRVYAWSQPDGEDYLVSSDDLAVSPPIVELPPGGRQVVRLVRLQASPSGRDGSYRVVVDELPGDQEGEGSRVHLRMRYVIPLFTRAADAAAVALSCLSRHDGAQLVCDNHGGRAAQLGASRLFDAAGDQVVLSEGLYGYVLPASRRAWPLPAAAERLDGATWRLETQLNGRPETLVVGRAP